MRHVRTLALCLAALLAVVAYAATSASALPEWGKCEAKAGGKFADSNCTVKTKKGAGSFEWKKGSKLPNVKFSGQSVGSGGLLTTGVIECLGGTQNKMHVSRGACEAGGGTVSEVNNVALSVECESEKDSGEQHSSKDVVNVAVTFNGCKILGSIPCAGAGLEEGEIDTNALKGELGYINKSTHEVGLRLTPVKKKGTFADFQCAEAGLSIHVGMGNSKEGAAYSPESKGGNDGIISPITPVNTSTSTFEQVYSVNHTTDENVPANFENKPVSLLEDWAENTSGESLMWSRAGEEISVVNTPVETGEIKA